MTKPRTPSKPRGQTLANTAPAPRRRSARQQKQPRAAASPRTKSLRKPMHSAPSDPTSIIPDAVLAGGLITAPAWGTWLMDVNQLLTTASLAIGLVLGCARLWQFLRNRRDHSPQN